MKIYSILLLGLFVPSVQAMEEKEQTADIENNTIMQTIAIACTIPTTIANTPAAPNDSPWLYWDEEIMMPITAKQRQSGVVYKRYNPNGN